MYKSIKSTISLFLTFGICLCLQFTLHSMQESEWAMPVEILMHTPGAEVFHGLLHANAALYEDTFDSEEAKKEHLNYIRLLQARGIRVIQVVDVLLQGTIDNHGSKIEGPDLVALRTLALNILKYDCSEDWTIQGISEQMRYRINTINRLHPKDLVKIILERPTVNLRKSRENNTEFVAESYVNAPLMNMHFLRDQQITTAKGVVLGKMNSTQREHEVDITEFVFRKMGVPPIYRVQGEGRLEGGDFMPAGDFALIGQGLRTNAEGVRQLLEHDVFGVNEVAVVKDPFKHQDQMHLDTYFNIIGPHKAVIDTIRRTQGVVERGTIRRPIRPTVDIYIRNGRRNIGTGPYICAYRDVDFFEYIEKGKHFELIDITDEEQLHYGCNFLCVGPNLIIGVNGVSPRYAELLAENGVNATFIDFGNITKSYGGPHCTTQVFRRARQAQ